MRVSPYFLALTFLMGCGPETSKDSSSTEPVKTQATVSTADNSPEALLNEGRRAAQSLRHTDRALAAFDKLIETYSTSPTIEFRRLALQAGLEKTALLLAFTPPHTGLAANTAQKVLQDSEGVSDTETIRIAAYAYKIRALSQRTPVETNEIENILKQGLTLASRIQQNNKPAFSEISPFYAELLFRDGMQKASRFSPAAAMDSIAQLTEKIIPGDNDSISRRYIADGRMLRGMLLVAQKPPNFIEAAADYRAVRSLADGASMPELQEAGLLARVKLAEIAPHLGVQQVRDAEKDLTALVKDRSATNNMGIRKATAQAMVQLADFALNEQPPVPTKAIAHLIGLERYANEQMTEEMRYYWAISLTKRAKILHTYFPDDRLTAIDLYNRAEQWLPMSKDSAARDRLVAQAAMDYAETLMALAPPRRAEALNVLNRAQTMFRRLRNPNLDPLFAQLNALRTRIEATPNPS